MTTPRYTQDQIKDALRTHPNKMCARWINENLENFADFRVVDECDLSTPERDSEGLGVCSKCHDVYWVVPYSSSKGVWAKRKDKTEDREPICYGCALDSLPKR